MNDTIYSIAQIENDKNINFSAGDIHRIFKQSESESLFIKNTYYINHLKQPVWLVTRNNEKIYVDPTPNMFENRFIIRDYYEVSKDSFSKIYEYLNLVKDETLTELHPFVRSFMNAYNDQYLAGHQCTMYTFYVDYILPGIQFTDTQKTRYIHGKDLLISIERNIEKVPFHPSAITAKLKENLSIVNEDPDRQFFSLKIIDNDDQIGKRYMFFAQTLYSIEPKKDYRLENGVYFNQFKKDPETDELISDVRRYDIKEAESVLGLFRTKEEALTAGDISAARAERIKELEYSIEESRRNLTQGQISIQNEKDKLERDRQKEKLSHERSIHALELQIKEERENQDQGIRKSREDFDNKLKIEREEFDQKLKKETEDIEAKAKKEREELELEFKKKKAEIEKDALEFKKLFEERKLKMNEHYDFRSMDRKDTSEIIKFGPAIIIGTAAIVALLMKK